ncbi:unnamed protein product [Boreogadus saida]
MSDLGTHLGLRLRVTLLWSLRKTSRPGATNCTIQSDLGTHLGLRSKVVPLPWMILRTSRPLATNRHTQSDYGTYFRTRTRRCPATLELQEDIQRPLATNRHNAVFRRPGCAEISCHEISRD